MALKLSHSFGFFEKLWFIYSQRLHKLLVNDKANFYLKPNDIISHRPTIFGYHEVVIEKLIHDASAAHSDFLLDLGANVGLTSSLVGRHFKRVDCVEPNELVFNILKTNLAMNLTSKNYHCHMIGLGKTDEMLNLIVPRDNFGGAFVAKDNDIADTRQGEMSETHLEIPVHIKNANQWLADYFSEMKSNNLQKGIVKIDVEGYEEIIFESLIAALPKNFELIIIMENWFDHFPIEKFKSASHDFSWYYVQKKKRFFHSIPFKFLGLSSSYRHELEVLTPNSQNPHDIVCQITVK